MGSDNNQDDQANRTLFVYGTLLRGFTNYSRYLGHAVRKGKATFLGEAITKDKYPLVVRPAHMKPTTRGPVIMEQDGIGSCIKGELFQVDDDTLEAMDILEGVRSGAYYKKVIQVRFESSDRPCTAYFFPANPELLSLPLLSCYTDVEHALYRAGPINLEIADLCQGRDSHSLSSPELCSMSVLPLRLLPGDDIVKSLRKVAEERNLDAAVVLSCVGSTAKTTLRPAGVPQPKEFDGKFEIVSLTGTLSKGGHHLHMSISDPECNVRGGHVMEGCIVRTTAEILLGLVHDVKFTRPLDARTGYDELSIICQGEKRRKLEE